MSTKLKSFYFEKIKIQKFIQEMGESIPADLLEALLLEQMIKFRELIDRMKAG